MTKPHYSILYRGSLSSCNYHCGYCPFSKSKDSKETLFWDEKGLLLFTNWIEKRELEKFSIFFTPWGEALTRKSYKNALAKLSQLSHVSRVVIQTNGAWSTKWLDQVDLSTLALWITFHPMEITLHEFLQKILLLHSLGVRMSIGVVGMHEHFDAIFALRKKLPKELYFWINAYKRDPNYYSKADIEFLRSIDPLFKNNLIYYSSKGRSCQSGFRTFSVDHIGTMRVCHFNHTSIGNLYVDFPDVLTRRVCEQETCHCHIGYVHLDHLKQKAIYGDGLLERIPICYEA